MQLVNLVFNTQYPHDTAFASSNYSKLPIFIGVDSIHDIDFQVQSLMTPRIIFSVDSSDSTCVIDF